jgi:hypothetical protein
VRLCCGLHGSLFRVTRITSDYWGTATPFREDLRRMGRFFALFLGRPTGSGRNRRPNRRSNLLRKLSLPNGRPRCVLRRI